MLIIDNRRRHIEDAHVSRFVVFSFKHIDNIYDNVIFKYDSEVKFFDQRILLFNPSFDLLILT